MPLGTNTTRGSNYATVVAATPAAVKTSRGYLQRLIVTTAATTAVTLYDNPSGASGTVLYASPAGGLTLATVIELGIPFNTGCWCVVGTGGVVNVVYD